jgi:23S rRNA pseudouridine1911/1915/1917 synthase
VLYDDADIVVVNKPAGMVVHPAAGHQAGTLVNALLHHVKGLSGVGGQERPGIVHRLDRGTSGLMVIAKHDQAHRALSTQFESRTVAKEYLALVWGRPTAGQTFVRAIGRDPKLRQRMSTRARHGRPAETRVIDVEPLGLMSLVRVGIATGRTHQIRVHLSEAGHPVVGDRLYGGVRRLPASVAAARHLERPFLHATRLEIDHPATGERKAFEAPLPGDLTSVLETLRRATAGRTQGR